MGIVYLILAHNNFQQIKNLIYKLDSENNSFIIHFDLNGNDYDYENLELVFRNKKNVFFSKRNRCYWGDISLVDASIDCLKTAYHNQVNFDYAVLISGQHYPIKTNKEIEKYLKTANNKSFMSYFSIPGKQWENENGGKDRIIYYHFNKHPRKRLATKRVIYKGCARILKGLSVKRKLPFDIEDFYGGSQWWCLTNECCTYVLNFIKEKPEIYKYFKYVLIPDEIFFQTILLNSKFKDEIINDNLTYINWGKTPTPSPLILNESDYYRIKKSNSLWARKLDMDTSEKLIKMLNSETG
ncbi:beta-1,6-N-acetylglucosaminyltransferase [Priestia sp. GS2]|uniref:beta-1,6-N-acetylglucosaminyltransferase n=1 Tax=Priestia sp. GS2 TaxID=3117403 RepID=UPI002EDAC884